MQLGPCGAALRGADPSGSACLAGDSRQPRSSPWQTCAVLSCGSCGLWGPLAQPGRPRLAGGWAPPCWCRAGWLTPTDWGVKHRAGGGGLGWPCPHGHPPGPSPSALTPARCRDSLLSSSSLPGCCWLLGRRLLGSVHAGDAVLQGGKTPGAEVLVGGCSVLGCAVHSCTALGPTGPVGSDGSGSRSLAGPALLLSFSSPLQGASLQGRDFGAQVSRQGELPIPYPPMQRTLVHVPCPVSAGCTVQCPAGKQHGAGYTGVI